MSSNFTNDIAQLLQQLISLQEEMTQKLSVMKNTDQTNDEMRAKMFEIIMIDQVQFYQDIFNNALMYLADNSSSLQSMHFYQQKIEKLNIITQNKLRGLEMKDPQSNQDLRKLYDDIQGELARCGQKQQLVERLQQVISDFMRQMCYGKEASAFVTRDFDRLAQLLREADDQNVFSRSICSFESFGEVFLLKIQNSLQKLLQLEAMKQKLSPEMSTMTVFFKKQCDCDLIVTPDLLKSFVETWRKPSPVQQQLTDL